MITYFNHYNVNIIERFKYDIDIKFCRKPKAKGQK